MLSEFSSGHICACYEGLGHFHLDGVNLQMQTHFVSKIMHQKYLAVFLGQSNYSKKSFIVLVPEAKYEPCLRPSVSSGDSPVSKHGSTSSAQLPGLSDWLF